MLSTAFEYLYNSHSRRVYSLCLRMIRNAAEAEDLTQSQDWYLPRRFGFFDLAASIDCEHRFDASTPENAKGSALRRLGSAGHE